MDAKLTAQFWTNRDVVELDKDAKLAAVWMISNSGVNLAGYAEVSDKVFRFETEVDTEAMGRALTGLGESFVRCERGYWMRNFIRMQLGEGDSLLRNAMCGPLLRDMKTMPRVVVELVLEEYPELRARWEKVLSEGVSSSPSQAPRGGLPSPADAPGIRKSRVEKRGEEQSRAEQSGAELRGVQGGTTPAPTVSAPPAEFGEPLAGRMISLGLLKARQASEPWAPAEVKALRDAGLDTLSDVDFLAQVSPVRAYYLATNIPREKDRRRKSLRVLLENWTSELDTARTWQRDNSDGIARH
jgi:hypothetical protein